MKTILWPLISAFLASPAFAAPVFLGLSGPAQCTNQDQLLAEVERDFIAPLEQMSPHVKAVYNYLADADCELSLGLIAEAKDPAGERPLADYVHRLEQGRFHGLSVQYQPVVRIEEAVGLTAGLHVPGKEDMTVNYQTEKSFPLRSVSEWEGFTDTLGKAFQSRRSADFRDYLAWFMGPEAYPKLARDVLTQSNMVGAQLEPKLVLANGKVIDGDSGMSPFFEMPFFRNCWAADYENGMCISAP